VVVVVVVVVVLTVLTVGNVTPAVVVLSRLVEDSATDVDVGAVDGEGQLVEFSPTVYQKFEIS
jgi:hypothetical protein